MKFTFQPLIACGKCDFMGLIIFMNPLKPPSNINAHAMCAPNERRINTPFRFSSVRQQRYIFPFSLVCASRKCITVCVVGVKRVEKWNGRPKTSLAEYYAAILLFSIVIDLFPRFFFGGRISPRCKCVISSFFNLHLSTSVCVCWGRWDLISWNVLVKEGKELKAGAAYLFRDW